MVVRDDSKRSLDMDEIVESVKAQYANMASRSREEAENWNKKKVKNKVQQTDTPNPLFLNYLFIYF